MGDLLAFRDLRLSRLGAMAGGGGGSPSITSPGSIDAQPLVGQVVSIVEPLVTGASSVAYQWYDGLPPTTAISGWTSAAPTPTDTQYAYTSRLWRRATYTNGAGDTVEELEAPDRVGRVYSDDFAGYSISDTWTQLDTLYDRSGSVNTTVVSKAEGPAGKALTVQATTSSNRVIVLTAAATFGAANVANTGRVQGLWALEHTRASEGRYYMRFPNTGLTTTAGGGVTVYCTSTQSFMRLQVDTDSAPDNLGTLLAMLTVGAKYFLRCEHEGATVRAKVWALGDTEPDWVERVCSTSFTPYTPFFGTRYALSVPANQFDLLYWSAGFNADAPFWSGYVPPPAVFADPIAYEGATSATTATYFDSEIIFTAEDI